MKTKTIVYGGIFAAMYAVLTLGLAPIGYGPVQMRVSSVIKPLALLNPAFAFALAFGTFMSDLFSPFLYWDWAFMPIVDFIAALVCYALRRVPVFAICVQSLIISIGVCVFPLGMGGHLPFEATIIPVLIPNTVVPLIGYFLLWRREDLKEIMSEA